MRLSSDTLCDARMNPMHSSIRIFARGLTRSSLYDTARYEACEGTEGLTDKECAELIAEWQASERADYGRVVTKYEVRNG